MTFKLAALSLGLLAAGCAQEHQYLSYEAAEQVCVALASCRVAGVEGVGGCAWGRVYADANVPGVYRCVLAAGADCDAVRACFGISRTPIASCVGAAFRHCEGDAIVECMGVGPDRAYVQRARCGAPELPSGELTSGSQTSQVSAARCVDDADRGPRCIVGTPCDREGTHCTTVGHLVACEHGLLGGAADCAPGFECREDSAGEAHCLSFGELCTDSVCDRGRLRVCGLEEGGIGHLWPFDGAIDCAALGLLCDPHRGCVAPAMDCDPIEWTPGGLPACDGGVLTYCATDGRVRSYDCLAHGWGGCRGTEGDVACVPLGLAPP